VIDREKLKGRRLLAAAALGCSLLGVGCTSSSASRVIEFGNPAPPVVAVPVSQESYVGLVYTDPPPDLIWHGGAMISDASGALTDYAISHMEDLGGQMMWLERLVSYDDQGRPSFEVLAVLRLPQLAPDEHAVIGDCRTPAGLPGPAGLVAVAGQPADPGGHEMARAAWVAEIATAKFVPLPTTDLSCGWEDDGV